MSVGNARSFFDAMSLDGWRATVADKIVKEIGARLGFLSDVGLDYLSLDRSAETLSGGEAQRIRLASQIGSGLTGVLYVLDEPTTGLHQADVERLMSVLDRLVQRGDTLLVIEHHPWVIAGADYVVELGPEGGQGGGKVVAAGSARSLVRKRTATGQVLQPLFP